MAGTHTDRGLDRLVNFTDAAVAIAITLLVLPLMDLVTDGRPHSVASVLADERWTFVAFALSFAVIAHFWVGHHRVFEHLRDYSNAILWTNFLWLASIVFIPFATQLLGELSSDTRGGNSLYIGVLIVASASLALIEWLAVRSPELQRSEVRGQLDVRGGLVALGLLLLALLLNLVAPSVGMLWLLLLFLAGPVARLLGFRKVPHDRDVVERPS